MTLVRVRLHALALPLRSAIATAHGAVAERVGWRLELTTGDGQVGLGEALPLPSFGGETHTACERALRRACRALEPDAVDRAARAPGAPLASELEAALAAAPVARAAIETALLDAAARRAGASLAALLRGGAARRSTVEVNALLAAGTPEALSAEVGDALAAGFRTLKLKVGARSLAEDVEAVRAVRAAAPSPLRLRLDANGAWSESEARAALRALEPFEPEWLEQPIAPGDPSAFGRLRSASGVALAADESAVDPREAEALLAADAVDAFVSKLPPQGGPARALAFARRAHEAGKPVAVTSFLDSTLGIAAAAQLAAAFDEAPPACGLATASLLARDAAEPMRISAGQLSLPPRPGLGVVAAEPEGAPIVDRTP